MFNATATFINNMKKTVVAPLVTRLPPDNLNTKHNNRKVEVVDSIQQLISAGYVSADARGNPRQRRKSKLRAAGIETSNPSYDMSQSKTVAVSIDAISTKKKKRRY